MFKTTIRQVIPVPKRDYCLFSGDSALKDVEIGEYVTDGINKYEILSIPLVHYNTVDYREPTDFILKPGEYDPNGLVGKTLYAV